MGERGGNNIYAIVRNNAINSLDRLGLDGYSISNLKTPIGAWQVKILPVDYNDETYLGFLLSKPTQKVLRNPPAHAAANKYLSRRL